MRAYFFFKSFLIVSHALVGLFGQLQMLEYNEEDTVIYSKLGLLMPHLDGISNKHRMKPVLTSQLNHALFI